LPAPSPRLTPYCFAEAFGWASSSAILREGFAYVEGGEVQAFAAVLLGAHIAGGSHQIGLGGITQLLVFGEQGRSAEGHGVDAAISWTLTIRL
jgi:hypothetical protein